jgi:hypothetical protein
MPHRITRRAALTAGLAPLVALGEQQGAASPAGVERWGIFETQIRIAEAGDPFGVAVKAQFTHEHRTVEVAGFYDGDGVYKVRFMPDSEGEWTWKFVESSGRFICTPAGKGNHGPVSVRNRYHFGHADGTRYCPFGTTCYAWTHQSEQLENATLATLKASPFNKIRMCVFPKWYAYNHGEPRFYPFPREDGKNDLTRFDPQFFQHLEQRVGQLAAMGIEADLILFHPYDNWGYASLPAEVNERYLRYTVARLAAYRNVWWSMANEWDFVRAKTLADWDRYFQIVQECDPYQHLRGIHNGSTMYDHAKPWVTHASIQSDEFEKTAQWRQAFGKPIVFDECKYEGNIPQRWGNLSAREMVRRFWLGVALGAWVGHGETYLDESEVLWWSKGGVLRGESAPRIAFLRQIVEDAPDLEPVLNAYYPCVAKTGEFYLYFLDYHRPAQYTFPLTEGAKFSVELIDPWEMKVKEAGTVSGKADVALTGEPYQAVRFRKL